jgi:hypothetical protein
MNGASETGSKGTSIIDLYVCVMLCRSSNELFGSIHGARPHELVNSCNILMFTLTIYSDKWAMVCRHG